MLQVSFDHLQMCRFSLLESCPNSSPQGLVARVTTAWPTPVETQVFGAGHKWFNYLFHQSTYSENRAFPHTPTRKYFNNNSHSVMTFYIWTVAQGILWPYKIACNYHRSFQDKEGVYLPSSLLQHLEPYDRSFSKHKCQVPNFPQSLPDFWEAGYAA